MTSTVTRQVKGDPGGRAKRVVSSSFGLVVMLIVQYVLGIAYNLYGTAPTATGKLTMFASPLIASHVIVGTLLVLAAIYQAVLAVRAGGRLGVTTSAIGLLSVLAAWACGSRFIQTGADGYSMAMASLTAVALLCYSLNVRFLSGRQGG